MNRYVPLREPRKKTEVWQIIYMDLMTIVMVFFVILWSLNQKTDTGPADTVGDQTARMIDLPADILFPTGSAKMTPKGQAVFGQLFGDDEGGSVLTFDTGGLTRRLLVIHGHTDRDGEKKENLALGYRRAFAAFEEIEKYGPEVADHVVLCSHANNSPAQETPTFQGDITRAQRSALRNAKAKNRRITIEDRVESVSGVE